MPRIKESGNKSTAKIYVHTILCGVCACLFFGPISAHAQSYQSNETEKIPSGLIFLDDATYASIPIASSPLMGVLPSSKDLTNQFPPPGNQGTTQGSCAAWAAAYSLKTYQEASERHWSIATDEHIFSPSFLYNQLNHTADCSGGLKFTDVLNFLHSSGVPSIRAFPYDPDSCSATPSAAIKESAEPFKIGAYRRVNVQDDTEVKSQISAGIPVLIGVNIDYVFWKLYRGDLGKGVYNAFDPQKKKGAHAIVLVGYDDGKQAYKVINSWGSGWGNQGFGWIAYDTFRQMVKEGYVIQDDPSHNYVQATAAASTAGQNPVPANQPHLQIGLPNLQINVPVQNPAGVMYPGIVISVPGQVTDAVGRHLQLVARFSLPDGQILRTHPFEQVYRDATGFVAVGTPDITITTTPVDLAPFYFSIPFYAITPTTNGQVTHLVNVTISAYVNSFLVFQTPPESFSFVY
jgi:hypothetical protein